VAAQQTHIPSCGAQSHCTTEVHEVEPSPSLQGRLHQRVGCGTLELNVTIIVIVSISEGRPRALQGVCGDTLGLNFTIIIISDSSASAYRSASRSARPQLLLQTPRAQTKEFAIQYCLHSQSRWYLPCGLLLAWKFSFGQEHAVWQPPFLCIACDPVLHDSWKLSYKLAFLPQQEGDNSLRSIEELLCQLRIAPTN